MKQINEGTFAEPVKFKTGHGAGLIRDVGQAIDLCLQRRDAGIGPSDILQVALDAFDAATDDNASTAVSFAREAMVKYLKRPKMLWV